MAPMSMDAQQGGYKRIDSPRRCCRTSEGRIVLSTPRRRRIGWAQSCPERTAMSLLVRSGSNIFRPHIVERRRLLHELFQSAAIRTSETTFLKDLPEVHSSERTRRRSYFWGSDPRFSPTAGSEIRSTVLRCRFSSCSSRVAISSCSFDSCLRPIRAKARPR